MSNNPLRQSLEDDLAAAIAQARGGKRAGAMAYELLRRDKRTHQFVGVVKGAEKAVFYESTGWSVVAVPFDETGVDGLGRRQWERLKERTAVERFVQKKGEAFWEWVHPRYRWAFASSS